MPRSGSAQAIKNISFYPVGADDQAQVQAELVHAVQQELQL